MYVNAFLSILCRLIIPFTFCNVKKCTWIACLFFFAVIQVPATSNLLNKPASSAAKKLYLTSDNGEASSGEEGSSASSLAVGFIANEFIIRDVLIILKEALTQLTSARLNYLENKVRTYTIGLKHADITPVIMLC